MRKTLAIKKAGSIRALAELLGVTTQAVHKWPLDLPPLRVFQLKEKKPGWFKK